MPQRGIQGPFAVLHGVFVILREVHLPQGRCGCVPGARLTVKSRPWLFSRRLCYGRSAAARTAMCSGSEEHGVPGPGQLGVVTEAILSFLLSSFYYPQI